MTSEPLSVSPTSEAALKIQKSNFRYVQIDAIGVGIASAAGPFLPVLLTRLGASNNQVGLLTSMPGITGLFLTLLVGGFLQTRRNVVPWFSLARLMVISCYALTGLTPFFISHGNSITSILIIWAFATLPQTMVAVAFTVVMNAVAGPQKRYDLLSRRWSTLGLTSAITAFVAGQMLDRIPAFPLNYQIVFLGLSIGGLISYYFSSHIRLPENKLSEHFSSLSLAQNLRNYARLVKSEPAFTSFAIKRFVYLSGMTLAAPLFPLYYVREVQASNAWIGFIGTAQTIVMLAGYYIWTRQSRRRGPRFALLCTTLGVAVYPALVASTRQIELIALFAGIAGIFQAGLDLVFFDELMKTVPAEYSATFVSLAQSMQYLSSIFAPLIGAYLAGHIGLAGGLFVSAALRLTGFLLFLRKPKPSATTPQNPQTDAV